MCKACGKWFQINRVKKTNTTHLLAFHLLGLSHRGNGFAHDQAGSTSYRQVDTQLRTLPHCADVTRRYGRLYGGILIVDGKFVKTATYEYKIPVIYGVDYLTHDIPTYIFSKAESYQACRSFFQSLRLLNYPLQGLVCDDNRNIYEACLSVYPKTVIQLCHNHYLRGLRYSLNTFADPTYRPFVYEMGVLMKKKRSREEFVRLAGKLFDTYRTDPRCVRVLADLSNRMDMLCGYMSLKGLPTTNNLIESMNSHLEGRLKTIKGFQSFHSANRWLNAYFLYRRVRSLTDCEGKFRHLNGKSPLHHAMKHTQEFEQVMELFR